MKKFFMFFILMIFVFVMTSCMSDTSGCKYELLHGVQNKKVVLV